MLTKRQKESLTTINLGLMEQILTRCTVIYEKQILTTEDVQWLNEASENVLGLGVVLNNG